MTRSDPIVVVGGGIIGVSIADSLRNADRPVVLLEKNDLLGAGTTRESVAMLGLSYDAPVAARRRSIDHYHSLLEDGTIDFSRIGTLKVRTATDSIAELERKAAEVAALGYDASFLEPAEVTELGVDPPESARVLHVPDEGYLDPAEIIANWSSRARSAGVEIRTGVRVTDVSVDNGAVAAVETTDGSIVTDTLVNAAGPWAPALNDMASVSLPLRHNYGPVLALDVGGELSLPNTSFPNGTYLREESTTQAFAGRHGVPYAKAERRHPGHARSVPESFYVDVQQVIEESISAVSDAKLVNEWVGMRTITPDGYPIVGETTVAGFHVACGLNGMGVTLAPAIGSVLATNLQGKTSASWSGEFDPDRFE